MSVVNTVNITRSVIKSRREILHDSKVFLDPLLFIFYIDDDVVSFVGDHFVFSEIEGYVSYRNFTNLLSPDMCKILAEKCNMNMKGVDYEILKDDHKVYIAEQYLKNFGKEARPVSRSRGTVLLLRQLD